MKLRLISDLHIDINKDILNVDTWGWYNNLQDIDYLLIAGDISGNQRKTANFLRELNKYIIDNKLKTRVKFVIGNHEPYSNYDDGETITDIQLSYMSEFNGEDNRIQFLDNECVHLNEEYTLIGTPLYTDFNLYGTPDKSQIIANTYINDFKYCQKYIDEDSWIVERVTPQDYIKYFTKSAFYINKMCNHYKNTKIILLTHFVPLKDSIAKEYQNNVLNPYFTSDCSDLLRNNPNIVGWYHGHTHSNFDYYYGKTHILCKPYGYMGIETGQLPSEYQGVDIEL